jgi:hypothetical protein
MKLIKINKINYYKVDDIIIEYSDFNKGCQTKTKIIDKHGLTEEDYIYAKLIEKKWIKTNGTNRKYDKFFVTKDWFDEKFGEKELEEIKDETEDAPSIIKLKDDEKFFDNDGNVVEIEVRGERDIEKCYFRVSDIGKGFDIKNLQDTIIDPKSTYTLDHYKYYFIFSDKNRKRKIKKLFLTYTGILKVLFSSRGKNADKFTLWASKTLFTAQLGTKAQKTKLASKLLGVDTNSMMNVLKTMPVAASCIYLFSIGTVADLRDKYDIDDDINDGDIVAKYGRSEDLVRRTKQHKKTYGSDIELLLFYLIDKEYVSEAEAVVTSYFKALDIKLELEGEDELIIFNPATQLKHIRTQYSLIGNKYAGQVSEQATLVKDLVNKHEKELMMKENEINKITHEKEISKVTHEKEIMLKDKEIMLKDKEINKITHEKEIEHMKYEKDISDAKHKNDILELKLELSELKRIGKGNKK